MPPRRPGRWTARPSRRPNSPAPADSTGGKKATGAKRHAVVDTLGLVWGLCITPANVADCKGARAAVRAASAERLVHLWADSAYRGLLVTFCWVLFDLTVEIVTRREGSLGFVVQHRRCVVERTFGWLGRWRRLNRNYEHTLASGKAVVQVALIGIMTRRLAKTNKK